MKWLVIFSMVLSISLYSYTTVREERSFQNPEKLSAFGFFKGPLHLLHPSSGVIAYTLKTPLFSNYAEKERFIMLPAGKPAVYDANDVFQLPAGTFLIKNFYYPNDFRMPEKGRRIMETRVMYKEESGWQTWPYIWNEEQTDAEYDPTGENITVTYINQQGKKITTQYLVPNKNQCKGCHMQNNEVVPIGISARHLNSELSYEEGKMNQLAYWQMKGMLDGMDGQEVPEGIDWLDEKQSLDKRARAYLDINCGHCHRPDGPANTSGLFLHVHETNPTASGIMKTPVAAGRGSGGRKFDIVPGKPDASILLYRMQTNDPGIAMPEIGREQLHTEGISLIREWIRQMK